MRKIFASLSLLALAAPAFAAVDVTAVVTEVGGSLAPIGLIGSAVLLVFVGIKTYKWIRRAM